MTAQIVQPIPSHSVHATYVATTSRVALVPSAPRIRPEAGVQSLANLYQLDIQIGPRLFHDFVVFEASAVEQTDQGQCIHLTGTLTVPGIFTASLKGQASETFEEGVMSPVRVSFEIRAKEHGEEFLVRYEGILTEGRGFVGTAFLEDGSLLGTFHAFALNFDR